ncbi:MAG: hypothetical protein ACYC5V_04330 [Gemmatimonadaceae bacterium]
MTPRVGGFAGTGPSTRWERPVPGTRLIEVAERTIAILKTLIAGVAWILAALRLRGGRQAKVAVDIATIVTMVVFAIPHSMWGSQAKW